MWVLPSVADLDDLDGVEADRRLIEDHHARVAQQRLGDAHALTVALGEVFDQPVLHVRRLGDGERVFDLAAECVAVHALGAGDKGEVFPRRHIRVDGRLLGQVTDARFGLVGLFKDVVPFDAHGSLRGGEATCHDVHGRGFSSAVGAQKAVDASGFHRQRQIGYGDVASVAFCDMVDFNQVHSSRIGRRRKDGVLLDNDQTLSYVSPLNETEETGQMHAIPKLITHCLQTVQKCFTAWAKW